MLAATPALVADLGPGLAVVGDFDAIGRGESILAGAGPIAGPDDLLHLDRRGELDLRPAAVGLGADPAMVVAQLAVVEVRDLVDGIALDHRRGARLALQGEVDLGVGAVDLELVDAGLGIARDAGDDKAEEPGADGPELVDVLLRLHGGALRDGLGRFGAGDREGRGRLGRRERGAERVVQRGRIGREPGELGGGRFGASPAVVPGVEAEGERGAGGSRGGEAPGFLGGVGGEPLGAGRGCGADHA